MDTITVYTDGGCIGNPGKGAWAYIILKDSEKLSDSAGLKATTNNQMELTAVIRALQTLEPWKPTPGTVVVHTDSQYVKNGITSWIFNWERNGWRTANKDPVKNKDLWVELKALSDRVKPQWKWVRGHNGDPLNEACDALVRETMDRLQD